MNLVFIHQSMPGQFRHVIAALAAGADHQIVCIGQRADETQPGIGRVRYPAPDVGAGLHPSLVAMDRAVRTGEAVAAICARLAREGFAPDVIIGHPGWGETLYLKQVLPNAPLLLYGEFFYRTRGADVDFNPESPQSLPEALRTRTLNAPLLMALDDADWMVTPTAWQRSRHPRWAQARMSVIPDGIDTGTIRPDPEARFVLPGGQVVTAEDELVTYAARGLEPYRGFPGFMRALPEVLRQRPAAQVVIAGADETIYGRGPPQGGSWRAALGDELGLDPRRVHFVGTLPQEGLRRLFQVSTVHAYLTVPFVLSWSLLEAMAAGCMVVASRTPPVAEVIEDGVNGWLVDFFDVAGLSDRLVAALAERSTLGRLRAAARATVATRYDLKVCVPQHIALIRALAAGDLPAAE